MEIDDILKKYGVKINKNFSGNPNSNYSQEYNKFKQELVPSLSFFERLCKGFSNIIRIKLKEKEAAKIRKDIEVAHLDLEPEDIGSFSLGVFLLSILVSLMVVFGIYALSAAATLGATKTFPVFLAVLLLFFSVFLYYYTSTMPHRLAQRWRLKASSQMVPCILYLVVYMRHTSNLELAVKFASENLQNPLALDFKKIFWDVETGKYPTIRESLDAYLESWREYSLEFVEAFHLIESSLYEPSEDRRIEILEKSLSVILDGVYEKMLRYTHDIQSPLTNLYMLGIVLPTLAIALLPLASTLMQGAIQWPHVLILFNVLIPFFVFYLTSQILEKRPGGYGEAELLEQNPDYHYYKSKTPYYKAALIALPFIIIGFLPLLFQYTSLPELIGLQKDYTLNQLNLGISSETKIFNFYKIDSGFAGPFSAFSLILSLFIPLGVAIFFAVAYKLKTEILIKTREKTVNLESEFASGMFQLGNRLADGIPAEMAFGRVAQALHGTPTADFFKTVNSNIQQFGMSVKEAIFNKTRGAIIYYPSSLITTSMQILIESARKGLQVAARALMSISQYVKNIHKINERLRDLLAEVVSGMRSNMSFLAPVLAGIIVGLSAMITTILSQIKQMMDAGTLAGDTALSGFGDMGDFTKMFDVTTMVPPYFLQIIIGIYLIEIVYILTITLVSVEDGVDPLREKFEISKNMYLSIAMYMIVSFISIVLLSVLAGVAIGGMFA